MNKKILSCFLALGLLGGSSAALIASKGAIKTEASSKTSVILDDNFNASENAGKLDTDNWVDATSSHSIVQSKEGITYLSAKTGGCGGENIVFSSKKKMSGVTSVSFDFRFSKDANSKWFSPLFTSFSLGESWTSAYAYSGAAMIGKGAAVSAAVNGGVLSSNFDFTAQLGKNAEDTWISTEIKVKDAHTATINFALKDGGSYDEGKAVGLTYNISGVDMSSCYFALSLSHDAGQIDFDNIAIDYDGGQLTEDFSSFDFEEDEDWGFFKKSSSQANEWSLSDSSVLTFDNAKENDLIYSCASIVKDDSIIEEIEAVRISFYVSFLDGSENEKLALVLGIDPSKQIEMSKSLARYEIDKSGATLVQYGEDGAVVSSVRHKLSNIASKGSNITLTVSKKGLVSVTEDGSTVKKEDGELADMGSISTYEGSIGILALTPINGTVEIDNVKVVNTTYYVPVTKSVTHNFSNDFFGNKGYEDFLCVDGDGGGKTKVEDGKLVWDMATDGTFFGSAYQYDSFILDYKLCSIYVQAEPSTESKDATALSKWIGLDLSKANRNAGAYGSYAMLLTLITPEGDDDYSSLIWTDQTSSLDTSGIKVIQHKSIPASYFRSIQYSSAVEESKISDGDAICFRYVSDGSTLKLYLKKASEGDFALYTEVRNLELNGYFALCCTGYTYCKIDDFSMANTSGIYVAADNEAPETITETKTDVVYDNNNVDVNLDKEIALNKNQSITLPLIFGIVAGVELIGIGFLAFLLLRKSKGGKHE